MATPSHLTASFLLLWNIATVDIPAQAQALPALQQGEPYSKERQKLLAQGWQKVIDFTKDCKSKHLYNEFARDTCFRYQEHEDCFANGYCAFIWKESGGRVLKIVTFGEEYGRVNWSFD